MPSEYTSKLLGHYVSALAREDISLPSKAISVLESILETANMTPSASGTERATKPTATTSKTLDDVRGDEVYRVKVDSLPDSSPIHPEKIKLQDASKAQSHFYTREEILSTLKGKGLNFPAYGFRKGVQAGIIPSPRCISEGRRSLRHTYTETAAAHAEYLARLHTEGKSLRECTEACKKIVEKSTVLELHNALNTIEKLMRGHPASQVSTHAKLILGDVAKSNSTHERKSGVCEWITGLAVTAENLQSLPHEKQLDGWTEWLTDARNELEAQNRKLRTSL